MPLDIADMSRIFKVLYNVYIIGVSFIDWYVVEVGMKYTHASCCYHFLCHLLVICFIVFVYHI